MTQGSGVEGQGSGTSRGGAISSYWHLWSDNHADDSRQLNAKYGFVMKRLKTGN